MTNAEREREREREREEKKRLLIEFTTKNIQQHELYERQQKLCQ